MPLQNYNDSLNSVILILTTVCHSPKETLKLYYFHRASEVKKRKIALEKMH